MPITATRADAPTVQHPGAVHLHPPGTVTAFDVSLARTAKAGGPMSEHDRAWPGLMRRAGRVHLGLWRLEGLAETVELLITELVTNGFQHGSGGAVGVRLARTEAYVWIEVASGGGAQRPCAREAGPEDESGRGLRLVEVLADAWGVTADGARTWCLLAVAGGE
ncbi:ATP-binding protein [Streptomyces sp. NPDC055078]